jgi:hypothetical protein
VTEEELGYQLDLKGSFNDIMMQTYNHYREHPLDEEDSTDSVAFKPNRFELN